jgi:hypothetical protein
MDKKGVPMSTPRGDSFSRWGATRRSILWALAIGAALIWPDAAAAKDGGFTIAVIPDTQYYLDYTHQTAAGFPFDARDLFLEQMRFIAAGAQHGDIAFVTSVGDVWEHQTLEMDPDHIARGFKATPNSLLPKPAPEALSIELPTAREAFGLIAGKVPFSVVPGNHDYDAMWLSETPPAEPTGKPVRALHLGGLNNFRSAFGDQSSFFKGKPWYVASHDGGTDSAEIFTAGGYSFLHIGLQFDAPDASLRWAESVIRRHPGLPTIVSTHDFLNNKGMRTSAAVGAAPDPEVNSPQQIWDKFVSRNDQIFLVICGHEAGQSFRSDTNAAGHMVYQVLADYQERAQTRLDAGLPREGRHGIGDGWLRLMTFDMTQATPVVSVRTYSPHYKAFSTELPDYAKWYKPSEKPALSDADFLKQDDFRFALDDFRKRFGPPHM